MSYRSTEGHGTFGDARYPVDPSRLCDDCDIADGAHDYYEDGFGWHILRVRWSKRDRRMLCRACRAQRGKELKLAAMGDEVGK